MAIAMATAARVHNEGQLTAADGRWLLRGALTFDSVPALWPQGAALCADLGSGTREVDLGGVDHVDSAGLALLVAWQARAHAGGGVLRYTSVPERLLAIARISEAQSLLAG